MEVISKPIDDLIPYINNPKKHPDTQVDKIASSIKNYGFTVPVVVDGRNEIIMGHGRLQAARKLGLAEVPCIVRDDLSEAQVKALRIADNKVSESEWDIEILLLELEEIEDFTGFDLDEIQDLSGDDKEVIEDEVPEPPDEPITKLGDLWLLGRHRLLCGDSTKAEDVERLMDGKKAHMCFTDPPYNVSIGTIKHPKFKQREIENDSMKPDDFWDFCTGYTASIRDNVIGCVYIAGAQGPNGRIMFCVADELMHCSTTIIWNKDQFTLGRGKYHNRYEPIWFGWVESGNRFSKERNLVNVWDIPRPQKSDLHPTMKPVTLVARALGDASMPTDMVLDLFGGSGSTLIAAEQLNRICYMMELDPKYCDVIVERWENLTGQKAELSR